MSSFSMSSIMSQTKNGHNRDEQFANSGNVQWVETQPDLSQFNLLDNLLVDKSNRRNSVSNNNYSRAQSVPINAEPLNSGKHSASIGSVKDVWNRLYQQEKQSRAKVCFSTHLIRMAFLPSISPFFMKNLSLYI